MHSDRNRAPRTTGGRFPLGWASLLVGLALVPHAAGCGGVIWGNVAVLAVTLGIFFGTLSLGRRIPPTATGGTGPGDSQADHSRTS